MNGGNGVPNGNASAIVEVKKSHHRGTIRLDAMLEIAKTRHRIGKAHELAWNAFAKNSGMTYSDEVTPKRALDYLDSNYGSGNGKSFNNNKSALNTIFRCCLIEAGLDASPFASIMDKTVTAIQHHRNLTLEEIDLIMKNANPLIQVMVMLSRWTSLRLETCARITENMLDSEKNVFVIDPGKTKRFDKWVCVPVFKPLKDFLFLPEIKSKFPHDKDKPIVFGFGYGNQKSFSKSFGLLLKKLHISDNNSGTACFHSIRGTAITYFKEHGIRGEELRMITGHESSAVEDIYARDIATVSGIATKLFCV